MDIRLPIAQYLRLTLTSGLVFHKAHKWARTPGPKPNQQWAMGLTFEAQPTHNPFVGGLIYGLRLISVKQNKYIFIRPGINYLVRIMGKVM